MAAMLMLALPVSALARDDIRVVSISPPTSTPLQSGTSIPFEGGQCL
jgi:hypothetical protein